MAGQRARWARLRLAVGAAGVAVGADGCELAAGTVLVVHCTVLCCTALYCTCVGTPMVATTRTMSSRAQLASGFQTDRITPAGVGSQPGRQAGRQEPQQQQQGC